MLVSLALLVPVAGPALTLPALQESHSLAPTAPLVAPPEARRLVVDVTSLQGELPTVDPDNPRAALGGTPRDASALFALGTMIPPDDEPGLYDLTLVNTGTDWVEDFLIYVPGIPAPAEVPLLVVFHQGNASHRDAQFSTSYIEEAEARGWYLLAPLGATQINYSSIDSQVNTKFVLDWTLDNFNIDGSRIYGVGFSMGGGNALNYAARHMDPAGAMFAALVNHTGTVSLTGTYEQDSTARVFLEILFEGNPTDKLFEYQRSSVIDQDAMGQIVAGTNMAINLAHLPIQSWYATNDPVEYLKGQSEAFDGYMNSIGANHQLTIFPWVAHNWWILKETTICNWLDAQILSLPDSGEALVDRSGVYLHFDLVQDAAGAFTRFVWDVDAAANRLTLTGTENLTEATLHSVEAGLDPTQELEVVVGTSDGLGDDVALTGYTQAPVEVLRDGTPTASWVWQAGSQTLVLQEADGGGHVWTVRP